MKDTDESFLKFLVTAAVKNCHDLDLLDLIFKMLILGNP